MVYSFNGTERQFRVMQPRRISTTRDANVTLTEGMTDSVYGQLRRIAQNGLAGTPSFGATDLVHEAFVRLARSDTARWRSREHFIATVSRVIRHVQIDRIRRQRRLKRRAAGRVVPLDSVRGPSHDQECSAAEIADALAALATRSPAAHQVVVLLMFRGMNEQQAAAHLGVSRRRLQRDWQFARAWLIRRARPPRSDSCLPLG